MKPDTQLNAKLMRLLLWSGVIMIVSIVVMQGFLIPEMSVGP